MHAREAMTALRPCGKISFAGAVKRAYLFDDLAVLVQYWCERGNDGIEVGVRVEVESASYESCPTEYEAPQIHVRRPAWRADLFRSLAGEAGNWDAAHYHPNFVGNMPGPRVFDQAVRRDPVSWLRAALTAPNSITHSSAVHPFSARTLADLEAGAADHIATEVRDMLDVLDEVVEQFTETQSAG